MHCLARLGVRSLLVETSSAGPLHSHGASATEIAPSPSASA
jgi:hypothetical protein